MKPAIFASTILISAATALGQLEWSDPAPIAPLVQENYHDTTPAVALDSNGTLAVAWVQQNVTGTSVALSRQSNILVSYSNNQGQTWAQPDILSEPNHYDGEVDVAAGQIGEFLITWTSGDYFSEYRLHTARTLDTGEFYTFETIADRKTAYEYDHIAPQVAIAGGTPLLAKSSWILEPLQTHTLDGYIWTRDDSASTWTETAHADSPEVSHNYKTISVDLAADTASNAIAIFQREYLSAFYGYYYRIAALTTADAGATWINHYHFTPDSWRLKDAAVAGGNGTWTVVAVADISAFSVEPLYIVKSDNDGISWTGATFLSPPTGSVNHLSLPSIATDGNGTWIATCHGADSESQPDNYQNDGEILYSMSTDNGETWTPLEALEHSPKTDTAIETAPQASYLGSGKWAILWSRADHEFTDSNIVIAIADTNNSSINDWQIY